MTIRVDKSLVSSTLQDPGSIIIQVSSKSETSSKILSALHSTKKKLWEHAAAPVTLQPSQPRLPRPKFLSGPVETPDGPIIFIDAGSSGEEEIMHLFHLLVEELRKAEVREAVLHRAHDVNPIPRVKDPNSEGLFGIPNIASLHLYPARRGSEGRSWKEVPDRWLTLACEWFCQGVAQESDRAWVSGLITYEVPAKDCLDGLRMIKGSGLGRIVGGELGENVRVIDGVFHGHQRLGIGLGGSVFSPERLISAIRPLIEFARKLREIDYAHITFEKNVGVAMPSNYGHEAPLAPEALQEYSDQFVFDAFHWQLVGKKHMKRMAKGLRENLDGTQVDIRKNGDGMYEVILGRPEQWLFTNSERPRFREAGRSVFNECLLDHETFLRLEKQRISKKMVR